MLLLTAFEPFDGTGINSSLETLREIERRAASNGESAQLATAVLPVRYDDDVAAYRRAVERCAVERCAPDAVLLLGQSTRPCVEIERVAINLKLVAAEPPRHEIIVPEAPPAYFATWPIEATLRLWNEGNLPAQSSAHAGTYLCNHIFYRALHEAEKAGWSGPIGFLHLPRLKSQIAPSSQSVRAGAVATLPLEALVECVQAAIAAMRQVVGSQSR